MGDANWDDSSEEESDGGFAPSAAYGTAAAAEIEKERVWREALKAKSAAKQAAKEAALQHTDEKNKAKPKTSKLDALKYVHPFESDDSEGSSSSGSEGSDFSLSDTEEEA
jgi:hypothetical protein